MNTKKSTIWRKLIWALPLLGSVGAGHLASCSDDKLSADSVIVADKVEYNDFDRWLQQNYIAPYNIEFKYRYDDKESDMNYYIVPPYYELAIKMAHLVKYVCIEAYDEVGTIHFTRAYFPKMIFATGEWEYDNNGTFVLGTAEGGRKIFLHGVNYLDLYLKNASELNMFYLKTIHHEFTHILNQTKSYTDDFQLITGSGYVADKWNEYPFTEDYLKRGFISAYAQHSHQEDIAEMLAIYICNTPQQWDYWMKEAGEEGARSLNTKLEIVRDYMLTNFDIDISQLRSAIQRRQKDIVEGLIDMTSVAL